MKSIQNLSSCSIEELQTERESDVKKYIGTLNKPSWYQERLAYIDVLIKEKQDKLPKQKEETPTEKLYNLYIENKKNHDKTYVKELMAQIEMFATESSVLSRIWIQEELERIIHKSANVN
jgi:hypothetical protein